MDLKEVEKLTVRKFSEAFKHLTFNVEFAPDKSFIEFRFDAVKITGLNSEVYIALACGSTGVAMFTMLFPKLKRNLTTLTDVNNFNLHTSTFKAFLDGSGYLMLENAFPIYTEQEFVDQALEFISRTNNLPDNPYIVKVLTNKVDA